MLALTSSDRILFIGDSITDCGRRTDAEGLGDGYPRIIRDYLLAKDPAYAPVVLNRGISGDRVTDLAARWSADVLDLAPSVLSVSIGINDVWHGLAGRNGGVPIDRFFSTYDDLLARVASVLPQTRIVLCEPSAIWPPAPEDGDEALVPYVAAVHRLAAKHSIRHVIPVHRVFGNARIARSDVRWAPDGVHPASCGHMLIARSWLAETGLL